MRISLMLSLVCLATTQLGAPKPDRTRNQIDWAIENLPPVGREGVWSTIGGYGLRGTARDLRGLLSLGVRMSDEQWTRALDKAGVLRSRDKWPAGMPVAVSMNAPAWLHPVEMHAVPRDAGLMSLQVGDLAHLHCGLRVDAACAEKQKKADYQEIGTLEVGKHHIVFDVTVEEGSEENGTSFGSAYVPDPRRKQPPGTVLWRGPLAIDVEVVPTLEEAMPSIDSSALSEVVRKSLYRVASPFEKGDGVDGHVRVRFRTQLSDIVAYSLEFELCHKDVCLQRGWTLASTIQDWTLRGETGSRRWTEAVDLGLDLALQKNPPAEELELRVRGVSKDVLRDWTAKEWWSGSFSIPLSSLPIEP